MSGLLNKGHEGHYEFRESPQDYRTRRISHYIIYFTIGISSLFYSALLVSLWPYLNNLDNNADKTFLGYLASTGAMGTTLLCPVFGKWSNSLQSCRLPILFTLICGVINYLVYVSLPMISIQSRRHWFLFARVMTGMNDINIGLSRGYIAESTLKSERRQAISILTGIQTIAFACGPALQSLMVPIGETGVFLIDNVIKVDMYTAIGWLALLSIFANIILLTPMIFKPCDMRHVEKATTSQTINNKYYKLIASIFIFLQFLLICNYLFLKVLGTPLAMDEYAMNRPDALQYNSNITTLGALVSLVAIIILDFCCKRIGEMNVMYVGFIIMMIGRFVMYPMTDTLIQVAQNQTDLGCPQWSQDWCQNEKLMSKTQFILSNVLDNFGYSWTITLIYTKFSQVLGTKQQIISFENS